MLQQLPIDRCAGCLLFGQLLQIPLQISNLMRQGSRRVTANLFVHDLGQQAASRSKNYCLRWCCDSGACARSCTLDGCSRARPAVLGCAASFCMKKLLRNAGTRDCSCASSINLHTATLYVLLPGANSHVGTTSRSVQVHLRSKACRPARTS